LISEITTDSGFESARFCVQEGHLGWMPVSVRFEQDHGVWPDDQDTALQARWMSQAWNRVAIVLQVAECVLQLWRVHTGGRGNAREHYKLAP
jgi:hypothetical protein